MSYPLLSIIIVSYNTKELLEECIESVVKSSKHQASSASYEIIVVDNNSKDGTREYLEKLQNSKTQKFKKHQTSNIKVILNNRNLGFAKAVNQGIKKSKGKYILLLNSDIKVLPGTIKELINFVQKRKDAGIVAPKLLNKDGKASQASCYKLPTIRGAINEYWFGKKGSYEKYLPRGGNPVKVEAVIGAAMLIPKAVIDVVGLLDEKYFMYFEDLDYCRRVDQNGLAVYYLPQVKVIHHHGASGKKIPSKVSHYLVKSSKKFNGFLKYNLLKLIIYFSQIKNLLPFFLLILGCLFWAMKSLLGIDYFASHDSAFHLIRLFELNKSIKNFEIPVRWAPGLAHGLGVPIFNYFYPLSYYLGEIIHLLGGSFAFSIRAIFIGGYFLGFALAFLFLKNFFAKLPSFLGALFYVFSPYIFLDIYVRGNLPEFLALMILPGVFWGYTLILKERNKNVFTFSVGIASILFSLLIMAHNIVALLGAGWLVLFLLFSFLFSVEKQRIRKVLKVIFSLLLGLGLSAFFWLPAIGETKYTYLSQEKVFHWWNHFPTIKQLIYSPWEYGSSLIGSQDLMSFQIGIPHLFLALMGAILIFIYAFEKKIGILKHKKGLPFFSIFSSLFLVFLMNHRSSFIWRVFPPLARVQFPWRLLGFLNFSLISTITFLFGEIFKIRKNHWHNIIGLGAILITFVFYYSYPRIKNETTEAYILSSNEARETTTNANEILPIGAQKDYWNIETANTIECSNFNCQADLKGDKEEEIVFRKFYFPSWQGKIDGQLISIYSQKETGLIALRVPPGQHYIEVILGKTKLGKMADIISLTSWGGLVLLILFIIIKKRYEDQKQ